MTPRASILRLLPPVPQGSGAFRARHGIISGYYAGRDHVSASLYWFGDFDPWVDRTLRRLARPGDVVLDIGANIGATSLVLARAVGPSGKVFAFEPHPQTAVLLRANLAANGLAMVDVQELALSDTEGSFSLQEPPGQPGMARLGAKPVSGKPAVSTLRLDGWLADRPKLGRIAVCKIDVEGHEPRVLDGMVQTLAAGRIAAIVFERHLPQYAPDDPVFARLTRCGYRIFRIEKSPLKVHYVDPVKGPKARVTSDFVACHSRSDAQRRLGIVVD
jgi:FkbM family methyltransferase